MNKQTEALKLAQELNKYFTSMNGVDVPERVSVPRDEWRRLYESLAEQPAQQQEPVAWYDEEYDSAYTAAELDGGNVDGLQPLYTSPPSLSLAQRQRSVKPLTDEEIEAAFFATKTEVDNGVGNFRDGVRFVEAAHGIYAPTELKEKNT